MDFFESPYYRLNKRLLSCLGQWPLQTPNERNFYRTTTVFLIGSIVIPELIKFGQCLGDPNGMIECLPVLCIHFRSVVKFVNCSVKAPKMRKLINRIKDDWTVRAGDIDEGILRSYAERGRLLTVVYTVYMFGSLAVFLAIPLIPIILDVVSPLNQSRDRIYLLQTEYFVDQDKRYFYLIIHAYIAMPLALGVLIAYDTMYAVYVHHACSIFASLGARLQSIGGVANNKELKMYIDPVKRTDEVYANIVACIKMHNEAVENANLLESSNCISFLFVVGSSMLSTIITGFKTVTNLDRLDEVFRFVFIVIGELIHLFYIFGQGQVLMEHSEEIFINAYNVEWYDISPRARKLLILMMLRSLEPCKLTAGKVIVLSMENYAVALKTSMSYFTVLLSMQ